MAFKVFFCLAAFCLMAGMGSSLATEIPVRQYGAVPGDGQDDTEAFRKAVEACRPLEESAILMESGQYDFSESHALNGNSLALHGLKNFALKGDKTLFRFSGRTNPLGLKDCRNVRIAGLSIDWDRPPYLVGMIESVSGTTLLVRLEKEFPMAGGESIKAIMEYDPVTRKPRRGGVEVYWDILGAEKIGEDIAKVTLKNPMAFHPGALAVLRYEVYGRNAFEIHNCADISISDSTVFCCPGMGFFAIDSENLSLQRFQVRIAPNTTRPMSTTADATHFINTSGAIRIEDCFFEGMGDDAVNVHGFYLKILEKVDAHTVIARHNNGFIAMPSPGDVMEYTAAGTVLLYATGTVQSAEAIKDTHKIVFRDPMPDAVKVGDMLGNATRAPKLTIRNCTVRGNRARGFLVQTRDALIENNRFEGCTGGGIFVTADTGFWSESIAGRNVTIRNNHIKGCNNGPAYGEGAINIFAHIAGYQQAPLPGVHRGLLIEKNVIEDTHNAGIYISAADGVAVRNNIFKDCSLAPFGKPGEASILIERSRNVTTEGNAFESSTNREIKRIVIGEGCDASGFSLQELKP